MSNELERAERQNFDSVSPELKEVIDTLDDAICACEETIICARRSDDDILTFSHVLLTEALKDCRSSSILIRIGYATSAAATLCSIIERTLIVESIAGDRDRTIEYTRCNAAGLPWKITDLANTAREKREQVHKRLNLESSPAIHNGIDGVLITYMYLCKLKHSNIYALTSMLPPSITRPSGLEPDTGKRLDSFKAVFLLGAIERMRSACFALAIPSGQDSTHLLGRWDSISKKQRQLLDTHAKSPPPYAFVDNDGKPAVGILRFGLHWPSISLVIDPNSKTTHIHKDLL